MRRKALPSEPATKAASISGGLARSRDQSWQASSGRVSAPGSSFSVCRVGRDEEIVTGMSDLLKSGFGFGAGRGGLGDGSRMSSPSFDVSRYMAEEHLSSA